MCNRLSGLVLPVALASLATACGPDVQREVIGEGITRETRGDTTVIRTSGVGTWGPLEDATEVFRVPANSPQTTLGRVYAIAATPDGGVILRDDKGPRGAVIRQFDSTGKFVRDIGRQGEGPGEYGASSILGFAFLDDGTIVVRDGGRVVLQYAADGTFLRSFPLGHSGTSSWEVYAGPGGSILVRGGVPRGLRMEESLNFFPPVVRYQPDGTLLDSLAPRGSWLTKTPAAPTDPRGAWLPLPDGRFLHVRTDKFGFAISSATGAPTFMAEVDAPAVPVLDDEHRELVAVSEWQRQHGFGGGSSGAGVPRVKPPTKLWVIVDHTGRIWIQRSAVATKVAPRVAAMSGQRTISTTWAEPLVFAAFEPDGTYLGEVRFPVDARIAINGDIAWAVIEDNDGAPVLVKYRVAR